MSAAPAVGGEFAAVLRVERELFNQKLAEARRRRPDLDAAVFFDFVRGPVARVVERTASLHPERARDVAHAAYDAALVLISEKLAGSGGRHPVIDRLWHELLPALAGLLSEQPARVIGSLSNAAFHLAGTPGARPEQFIELMLASTSSFASVDELLAAGQLAAWRAGLAHYRQGALAIGDRLPRIASALLTSGRLDWKSLRERLTRDPWWDPSAASELLVPRAVASVGGFSGFGGAFPQPPRVYAVAGQLFVSSARECFQLCADAFGATLHRSDPAICSRASSAPELSLSETSVAFAGRPLPLPALGAVTSAAAVPRTVAVTGALSHSVTLFAVA